MIEDNRYISWINNQNDLLKDPRTSAAYFEGKSFTKFRDACAEQRKTSVKPEMDVASILQQVYNNVTMWTNWVLCGKGIATV